MDPGCVCEDWGMTYTLIEGESSNDRLDEGCTDII